MSDDPAAAMSLEESSLKVHFNFISLMCILKNEKQNDLLMYSVCSVSESGSKASAQALSAIPNRGIPIKRLRASKEQRHCPAQTGTGGRKR